MEGTTVPTPNRSLSERDQRLYLALSRPVAPNFDLAVARFTNLADHSKISISLAIGLGLGGARGRRAAVVGLAAVAVSSVAANAVVKPLARRARPKRSEQHSSNSAGTSRYVRMPTSYSFPSGHTASAFAFAVGVLAVWPTASLPMFGIAGAVGYSRVHTGVHYPGDVALGALLGSATALVVQNPTQRALDAVSRPKYQSG